MNQFNLQRIKKLAYESRASQEDWEMYQLLRYVSEINPKTIVEIGCDGGGSLETWQKAFPKANVIGIEINERDELKEFNVIYADSQSDVTVAKLKDMLDVPIDFLFLDGDHHYNFVKKEYQLYAPLVREGGIIGFHDTNNRGLDGVEVDQFMAELDQTQSHKTIDFRKDNKAPGTRIIWK